MALSNDPMHKHPVPGKIVREWVMAARGYAAFEMKAGQVLRHVDLEGKQVPDVVCLNAKDHGESLIGLSNCPQERNPCNGFNPTPMGVIIYE
jgi:uncharacterized protein YcgI (DUF1989 family)